MWGRAIEGRTSDVVEAECTSSEAPSSENSSACSLLKRSSAARSFARRARTRTAVRIPHSLSAREHASELMLCSSRPARRVNSLPHSDATACACVCVSAAGCVQVGSEQQHTSYDSSARACCRTIGSDPHSGPPMGPRHSVYVYSRAVSHTPYFNQQTSFLDRTVPCDTRSQTLCSLY